MDDGYTSISCNKCCTFVGRLGNKGNLITEVYANLERKLYKSLYDGDGEKLQISQVYNHAFIHPSIHPPAHPSMNSTNAQYYTNHCNC